MATTRTSSLRSDETDASSKSEWFSEKEVLWPGQRFSLKIAKWLCDRRSAYQHVQAFESSTYGKVLILDGVIQLTERDEFAYQEMIAHIPMYAHDDPKSVLIVGGGDGGVLREVARHEGVERIVMCEIDKMVVDVAKEFKFCTATAFDDPRLELRFEDAAKYVKTQVGQFDVVIVDSSDPVGPAEALFEEAFFQALQKCLRKGGLVCTQGECIWLHLDIISDVLKTCGKVYPAVDYAYTTIPTYPSGQIGFTLSSTSAKTNFSRPARPLTDKIRQQLRYYNEQIHQAAFVLPSFAERKIGPLRKRPVTKRDA